MKKIDKAGRIVIPLELRKKYKLTEDTNVEFIDVGDGIILRSSKQVCKICHGKVSDGEAFPLCEKCITEVVKSYHQKKQRKIILRKRS